MEIIQRLYPLLKEGFYNSSKVFIITLVVSIVMAIPISCARLSKNKLLSSAVKTYIYVMRATPLLLQLMFIFFGLPMLPGVAISLDRFPSIYLAFILNYTAYFAEIYRGGIQSIDRGQWEGAKVLGLSKTYTFARVIFPQALYRVFPSISNEVISLVKDTSLIYILGVTDILKAAKSVSNTMASILPYLYIGIIYLLIVAILTKILEKIEEKVSI
ncbi:amino acid ABC transporter permease [Anaerococcus sp. AGMB09787]|uniref:amino acid ABC transporter permease n=1 Tax=Anaerococcus sp. AGMB09787 TaxID=2922869 RepID=UPI001FAFEE25|nr:amino acid ABC transporter permease [Anaerococcus sp. AGMB09787]